MHPDEQNLAEVYTALLNDREPPRGTPEDLAVAVANEIVQARKKGYVLEIPNEWPDIAEASTQNGYNPAPALRKIGEELAKDERAMPGYGQIFLKKGGSGEVHYVGGDGDERGFDEYVKERLSSVTGIDEVTYADEWFPKDRSQWVEVYPGNGEPVDNWNPITGNVKKPKKPAQPEHWVTLDGNHILLPAETSEESKSGAGKKKHGPPIKEASTFSEGESVIKSDVYRSGREDLGKPPIFVSTDREVAEGYEGEHLFKGRIDIKNPVDLKTLKGVREIIKAAKEAGVKDIHYVEHGSSNEGPDIEFSSETVDKHSPSGSSDDLPGDLVYVPGVMAALQKAGYDGMVLASTLYGGGDKSTECVAFNPKQLKMSKVTRTDNWNPLTGNVKDAHGHGSNTKPHQMTLADYTKSLKGQKVEKNDYYSRAGAIRQQHYRHVADALQLGHADEIHPDNIREYKSSLRSAGFSQHPLVAYNPVTGNVKKPKKPTQPEHWVTLDGNHVLLPGESIPNAPEASSQPAKAKTTKSIGAKKKPKPSQVATVEKSESVDSTTPGDEEHILRKIGEAGNAIADKMDPGREQFPASGDKLPEMYDKHLGAVKAHVAKNVSAKMLEIAKESGLSNKEIEGKLLAAKKALSGAFYGSDYDSRSGSLHEQVAAGFVDLWAETSGDGNSLANALQETVAKEFGVSDPYISKPEEDDDLEPSVAAAAATRKNEIKNAEDAMKWYVHAVYQNTQEEFKKMGVKSMRVYRGLTVSKRDLTRAGVKPKNGEYVHGAVPLQQQPLSSYTSDLSIVGEFAFPDDEYGEGTGGSGEIGAIVGAKIPVSQIFSTPLTGPGCWHEHEFVVLGNKKLHGKLAACSIEDPSDAAYIDSPDKFWGYGK